MMVNHCGQSIGVEKILERTKASISIRGWSAQYQQNPTSEEGALTQTRMVATMGRLNTRIRICNSIL